MKIDGFSGIAAVVIAVVALIAAYKLGQKGSLL